MPGSRLEFVCAAHMPFHASESPQILNVHAGHRDAAIQLPFVGDDTGDNISELNPHFSELTAIYWYWKNRPLAHYIGTCHYRRYFDVREPVLTLARGGRFGISPGGRLRPRPWVHQDVANFDKAGVDRDSSMRRMAQIVARKGSLIPRPWDLGMTIEQQYIAEHREQDWALLMDVLHRKDPVVGQAAQAYFRTNTGLTAWNMFVLPRDDFSALMAWWFDILLECHDLIDYPDDPYQQRVPAFMAERLFSFYAHWRGFDRGPKARVIWFEER